MAARLLLRLPRKSLHVMGKTRMSKLGQPLRVTKRPLLLKDLKYGFFLSLPLQRMYVLEVADFSRVEILLYV